MLRSLTQQVTLAAVGFVVVLLIALVLIIQSNQTIRAATTHLTSQAVPRSELLADLDSALEAAFTNAEFFIRDRQAPDLAAARDAIGMAKAALADLQALDQAAEADPFGQAVDSKNRPAHALLDRQRQLLLDDLASVVGRLTTPDEVTVIRQHDNLVLLHTTFKQARETTNKLTNEEVAAAARAAIAASDRNFYSTAISFGSIFLLSVIAVLLLRRRVVAPLKALAAAIGSLAAGQQEHLVQVTSRNEIGELQQGFNQAAVVIRQQRENLELQVSAATAARLEAEAAREQIAVQLAQIEEQRAAIREMSVPVLPVSKTTLVVPLVGALDSARLRLLQDQALRAITESAARCLLLDITGVPVVDTQVAQELFKVVRATRLLGAEVVLVGIRPGSRPSDRRFRAPARRSCHPGHTTKRYRICAQKAAVERRRVIRSKESPHLFFRQEILTAILSCYPPQPDLVGAPADALPQRHGARAGGAHRFCEALATLRTSWRIPAHFSADTVQRIP
jgi:rsbT co-antagonist protein RsbR